LKNNPNRIKVNDNRKGAYIYKRGNCWYVDIRHNAIRRKYNRIQRKCRSGGNKAYAIVEAQQLLNQLDSKSENGYSVYSWNIIKLINKFLERLSKESLEDITQSTIDRRVIIIKHFLRFCIAKNLKVITDISTAHFSDYQAMRVQESVSRKTIRDELSFLARDIGPLAFAVESNLLKSNPWKAGKLPKPRVQTPFAFNDEQVKAILKDAGIYYDYFMVLLHTGLRAGDAASLNEDQVDIQRGRIILTNQKTLKIHSIFLSDTLKKILGSMRSENGEFFPNLSDPVEQVRDTQGKLLLIKNPQKGNRRRDKVRRHLKEICAENNIVPPIDAKTKRRPSIGLHTFRHTTARIVLSKGGSIYELKALLNHSSISLTERYSHLSDERSVQVSELIDVM